MYQGLAFDGFNAHHQNGQVDHRIRSLQDLARCKIIHAHFQWPSAVTSNLWHFPILHTTAIINYNPYFRTRYTCVPTQFFRKS